MKGPWGVECILAVIGTGGPGPWGVECILAVICTGGPYLVTPTHQGARGSHHAVEAVAIDWHGGDELACLPTVVRVRHLERGCDEAGLLHRVARGGYLLLNIQRHQLVLPRQHLDGVREEGLDLELEVLLVEGVVPDVEGGEECTQEASLASNHPAGVHFAAKASVDHVIVLPLVQQLPVGLPDIIQRVAEEGHDAIWRPVRQAAVAVPGRDAPLRLPELRLMVDAPSRGEHDLNQPRVPNSTRR
eukprot:1177167-Prorocentrum_minimum.AAC.1